MCVCFSRVSLHCFNSCTPGIIYGPISSRCMGVHRDGIIMVSCSAFYGVYMMSVVSVMFLYPSRNDGGPHRNCSLYTRVIHVPSAFLRKLREINKKTRM